MNHLRIMLERLLREVADEFLVTVEDIRGAGRDTRLVNARSAFVFLAMEMQMGSENEIGAVLNRARPLGRYARRAAALETRNFLFRTRVTNLCTVHAKRLRLIKARKRIAEQLLYAF